MMSQEHTFQRANDLAVKGLKKLPLEKVRFPDA